MFELLHPPPHYCSFHSLVLVHAVGGVGNNGGALTGTGIKKATPTALTIYRASDCCLSLWNCQVRSSV